MPSSTAAAAIFLSCWWRPYHRSIQTIRPTATKRMIPAGHHRNGGRTVPRGTFGSVLVGAVIVTRILVG